MKEKYDLNLLMKKLNEHCINHGSRENKMLYFNFYGEFFTNGFYDLISFKYVDKSCKLFLFLENYKGKKFSVSLLEMKSGVKEIVNSNGNKIFENKLAKDSNSPREVQMMYRYLFGNDMAKTYTKYARSVNLIKDEQNYY